MVPARPKPIDAHGAPVDLKRPLDTIALDLDSKQDVPAQFTESASFDDMYQMCRMIAIYITSLLQLSAFIYQHLIPNEPFEDLAAGAQNDRATLSFVQRFFPHIQERCSLLIRLCDAASQRQRKFGHVAVGSEQLIALRATPALPAESSPAGGHKSQSQPASGGHYVVVRPVGSCDERPFACPFCRVIITVSSDSAWR
jgi:hypothetical protein